MLDVRKCCNCHRTPFHCALQSQEIDKRHRSHCHPALPPHFVLMNHGYNEFDTKEYLPSHLIPFIHSQGFMDADLDGDPLVEDEDWVNERSQFYQHD